MKKSYEVELSIVKSYTVKVVVEGDFAGASDPDVGEEAILKADSMNHEDWEYQNTEFEINDVTLLSKGDR